MIGGGACYIVPPHQEAQYDYSTFREPLKLSGSFLLTIPRSEPIRIEDTSQGVLHFCVPTDHTDCLVEHDLEQVVAFMEGE